MTRRMWCYWDHPPGVCERLRRLSGDWLEVKFQAPDAADAEVRFGASFGGLKKGVLLGGGGDIGFYRGDKGGILVITRGFGRDG